MISKTLSSDDNRARKLHRIERRTGSKRSALPTTRGAEISVWVSLQFFRLLIRGSTAMPVPRTRRAQPRPHAPTRSIAPPLAPNCPRDKARSARERARRDNCTANLRPHAVLRSAKYSLCDPRLTAGAEDVVSSVVHGVGRWVGRGRGRPQEDDLTVLVVDCRSAHRPKTLL